MRVLTNDISRQFFMHQEEYEAKVVDILRKGWYVLGSEVKEFEQEFAKFTGAKYCVGLASGLDALWLAVKLLDIGPGDEVIVQGNTYIASVMGITINGATPVFVEPDEFHNIDVDLIESKITENTKAILVVHLYGQASKMDTVMNLAKKYNIKVIEDCAQSHDAKYNGKTTGTFGDIGCFSFYPTKNLGAFGDAGAIVTDDPELDRKFRMYRNYGSEIRYQNEVVGANSRLDELQAGLLRVKLTHLDSLNKERETLCKRYLDEIDNPLIELPKIQKGATTVWHQFVIKTKYRNQLMEFLKEKEIDTIIHYPIPPHLSKAYQYLGLEKGSLPVTEGLAKEVLSLPLFNGMTTEEQDWVIKNINEFKV